jgi:hypothetical protein
MLSTEHPYNKAYNTKVYDTLYGALCGATPGGWYGVSEDEAVDALIKLAVNVMAVEHGDDGKEWVRERIYLKELDTLVNHLDGLIAWHLRRTAAAQQEISAA